MSIVDGHRDESILNVELLRVRHPALDALRHVAVCVVLIGIAIAQTRHSMFMRGVSVGVGVVGPASGGAGGVSAVGRSAW